MEHKSNRSGAEGRTGVKPDSKTPTKIAKATVGTIQPHSSINSQKAAPAKLSSLRFQPPTAGPFDKRSEQSTAFATLYNAGGFPARVNHGTAKLRLQWEVNPAGLDFDPLLIACFEGLKETKHPYNFVARAAIADLLQSPGAELKLPSMLGKLVVPLRQALLSRDLDIFTASAAALRHLAAAAGPCLAPHLGSLLVPLGKRIFERDFREMVEGVLQEVEGCGGPAAAACVRQKIPSYSPAV